MSVNTTMETQPMTISAEKEAMILRLRNVASVAHTGDG